MSRSPRHRLGTFDRLEDRTVPAVYTVMNLADAGPGSLRAAIGAANADLAADTIVFDPALARQTVALTTVGDSSDGPSAFLVTTPITILGTGQTLTRSAGAPPFRFFAVDGANADLTLEGLTLSGGLARGGQGGDGWSGGGGAAGLGGAVYNSATLTVRDCLFTNNTARGGDGGAGIGNGSNPIFAGGGGGDFGAAGGVGGYSKGGAGGGPQGGAGGEGGKVGEDAGGLRGGGGGGGDGGAGGYGGYFGGGAGGAGAGAAGTYGPLGGGSGGGFDSANGGGGGTGAGGGGGGGGMGGGGAVFSADGTVTLVNDTFAGNAALGGDGGDGAPDRTSGGGAGGAGFGGAVLNAGTRLAMTNCTLAGNRVGDGIHGLTHGGSTGSRDQNSTGSGLYNTIVPPNALNSPATLVNCVIAGNTGGPEVANFSGDDETGVASLTATAPNIFGTRIDPDSFGTIDTSGVKIVDPLLGPLQDNGGPTQTEALLPNSPALGAGSSAGAPLTDQRGTGRGAAPDLGAYEVQHPLSPVGVPPEPYLLYGPHPSASADEAFVKGLYQATLLRGGAMSEVAYSVNLLQTGAMTRAQLAYSFVNSPENRGNQVRFYYSYFLGRDAAPSEIANGVQLLQGGMSEADLMTDFILSPEYTGQNDDPTFVNTMYYAVLGRASDPAGYSYNLGQLQGGAQTRAQEVANFLRSPESIGRVVSADDIAYLKHAADPASLPNWVSAVQGGETYGHVAADILSSQEFHDNAAANLT